MISNNISVLKRSVAGQMLWFKSAVFRCQISSQCKMQSRKLTPTILIMHYLWCFSTILFNIHDAGTFIIHNVFVLCSMFMMMIGDRWCYMWDTEWAHAQLPGIWIQPADQLHNNNILFCSTFKKTWTSRILRCKIDWDLICM